MKALVGINSVYPVILVSGLIDNMIDPKDKDRLDRDKQRCSQLATTRRHFIRLSNTGDVNANIAQECIKESINSMCRDPKWAPYIVKKCYEIRTAIETFIKSKNRRMYTIPDVKINLSSYYSDNESEIDAFIFDVRSPGDAHNCTEEIITYMSGIYPNIFRIELERVFD